MTKICFPCNNDDCGDKIVFEPQLNSEKDWVKVVCSNCGLINNVSLVRVLQKNV